MTAAEVLPRLRRRRSSKTTRGGVEYGIGAIPLGGYVKIPGMHRPAPGDLRRSLPPDERDRRTSTSTRSTPRSSAATTHARARGSRDLEPARRRHARVPGARRLARRRTRTGARRRGSGSPSSPPARRSTSCSRSRSSPASSWSARSRRRGASTPCSPSRPQPPGMQPGDRILAIGGTARGAGRHPRRDQRHRRPAVHGRRRPRREGASRSGRSGRGSTRGATASASGSTGATGPGESPPGGAEGRARSHVGGDVADRRRRRPARHRQGDRRDLELRRHRPRHVRTRSSRGCATSSP